MAGSALWRRRLGAQRACCGKVELSRAGRSETLRIEEVAPERAAAVLRRYVKSVPVVRAFFDLTARSELADFIAEAPRHPVFRLTSRSDFDGTK
jgi:hypothetical protein